MSTARLLDRLAEYGSEFDGLANHEPMVVAAIELMGGSADQQEAFASAYHREHALEAFTAPSGALHDWYPARGDRSLEPELREFFMAEVAEHGSVGAMRRHVPALAPGVAGSAFHPLMRLAYARLRDDPGETARALAYWAATYVDMPAAAGVEPLTADPAEVLARVARIDTLRALPIQFLLWHNILQMGQAPEFAPVAGWLRIDDSTIRRMARDSIALYAATGDFCALHAVTGTHWIRVVTAEVPDARPVLLRYFWQGVAGLMGEMGWPELPTLEQTDAARRRPDLPSWPEIIAAACNATDEHDVSLTFSAWQEDGEYGDDLYRFAAAGRVGLIDPAWPPPWYTIK